MLTRCSVLPPFTVFRDITHEHFLFLAFSKECIPQSVFWGLVEALEGRVVFHGKEFVRLCNLRIVLLQRVTLAPWTAN